MSTEKVNLSSEVIKNYPINWGKNPQEVIVYTKSLYRLCGDPLNLYEESQLRNVNSISPVLTFFSEHPEYGPGTPIGKLLFLSACAHMIDNPITRGKQSTKEKQREDFIKRLYLKTKTEAVVEKIGEEIGFGRKTSLNLSQKLHNAMFEHLTQPTKDKLHNRYIDPDTRNKKILEVIQQHLPQK